MKAVVIVDGLNLHHALLEMGSSSTNLDVLKLSKRLLPKDVNYLRCFYFTTPPEHLGGKALGTFRRYSRQLAQSGVEIVEGRFQKLLMRCKSCGSAFQAHKEKETDVAIALKIVESASDVETSEILIFSADSDLSPALKLAKTTNPAVRLTVVQTSSYLRKSHSALMTFADEKLELRASFIHNYQFAVDFLEAD